MNIATLIASDRLDRDSLDAARGALASAGCDSAEAVWLEPERVCDVPFSGDLREARAALTGSIAGADVVVQPADGRAKRLLVADMDSTMITVECIDELADYAGVGAEVAAITERAMRGELDFIGALHARVALLGGLPERVLDECYRERVRATPGAATLVATMRAHGAATLLISGGFTAFADRVAADLRFDRAIANVLEVADGVLTGVVLPPIVDGARKAAALHESRLRLGLEAGEVLAVGDGANDLQMIAAAGLGVSYHGKPVLDTAADASIAHNDLTALLWAQGYARADWVSG